MARYESQTAAPGRELRRCLRKMCRALGIAPRHHSCRQEACFVSTVERRLPTFDRPSYSRPADISRIRVFSYLVLNEGRHPVVVSPELSPDRVTWGSFPELHYVVEPGKKQLIVFDCFLHYARISFRNQERGFNTRITIWYQGQG